MEATQFLFTHPDVPRYYEELFVPRIFVPWGEYLLSRVGLAQGDRVLDVATGPGTLARLAAARVGPNGRVTAADISVPMLEIARAKPPVWGGVPVDYVASPAAPLQVASASFDVAVCQQGFQFFPDRLAAARELHRALAGGGRVGIAVWSSLERNPLFAMMSEALRAALGAEMAKGIFAPFSWSAPQEIRQLLVDAGFRAVELETQHLPVTFELGPRQVVRALRATPLWGAIEALPQARRLDLEVGLEARAQRLMDNGRVRTLMESHIATGQK